jgi:hypothetical protein
MIISFRLQNLVMESGKRFRYKNEIILCYINLNSYLYCKHYKLEILLIRQL